ncbi:MULTISPECIES: LLM class flavin-dependent oxidoreductase [unclassified Novosphingobium]|uniref:LLM class flavin-dependent oxidoreductase n=1 Tax=unclassified Novosphingobium TaxID=2644732 RepID=UPI000EE6A225|nr:MULTISPECIES: LLM class flavin-dependent oxidoreductase [unclassified Novosphingobium]HCF25096.1 alkanesulfonate monooxygenase [Novosphingobium sp.]HQV02286.1 LLM class flavin-dependent oxidoreductase [Novosphingobium sp.]
MTQQCEIAWFSALCDDDYEFLGVPDPYLASSWEHCRNIVMRAEEGGFDNILLPSGYQLGLDTTAFAAAVATQVKRIKLLWATRMGEDWPPQLARRIATLDRILGPNAAGTAGRLNVNIISSDMPGEKIESGPRYARATEIMKIVRTLLNGEHLDFQGEFFNLKLDPARITTISGKCPAFYFGGLSHEARECAAEAADVYLMWPDTMDKVRETVTDMKARAAAKGRSLKFGYRAHVIVRETEDEARQYADRLLSKLDEEAGKAIREKSLDAKNFGVQRQQELRSAADGDGFVEENLWTGISRARSGCGAAIVGTPDQVIAKLRAYQDAGMEAFILSGYPHVNECDMFARYVLPQLQHGPLTL